MGKDAVDPIEAAQRDAQRHPAHFGGHEQQAACFLAHVGKLIAHSRHAEAETRLLAGALVCWLAEPHEDSRQTDAAIALAKATGGNAGVFLKQLRALGRKAGA